MRAWWDRTAISQTTDMENHPNKMFNGGGRPQ
jgi:hypothetical protein